MKLRIRIAISASLVFFSFSLVFSQPVKKEKMPSFAVQCMAFSPRGEWLAVGGGWSSVLTTQAAQSGAGFAKVYASAKWKHVASFRDSFTNHVATISFADEDTIATTSNYYRRQSVGNPKGGVLISCFTIKDRQEIRQAFLPGVTAYHAQKNLVCCLIAPAQHSQLGKLIFSTVKGTSAKGIGNPRVTLDQIRTPLRVFSPDGTKLLVCPSTHVSQPIVADTVIKLHDTEDGRVIAAFDPNGSFVEFAAFSPDGKLLALSCRDLKTYILSSDFKKTISVVPVGYSSRVLAFSPDGRTFATTTDKDTIKVFDTDTGKVRMALPNVKDGANCVLFSPDGTRLAVACGRTGSNGQVISSGGVRLFDANTGTLERILE